MLEGFLFEIHCSLGLEFVVAQFIGVEKPAKRREKVVQARNAAVTVPQGDVAGMAVANQQLGGALRGLLAIAESYPDLKANTQFLELQTALQNIEGDLSNSRRYYNATVRDFNTSIQQFPGVLIANAGGFKAREFFELENKEEAKNVEVKF